MRNLRRATTVTILVSLLVGLLPVLVASAGSGDDGEIVIVGSAHHSTVDGVDFTRFDCRYQGTADAISYELLDGSIGKVDFDVTCSLILPSDPDDWNGNILVEPLDIFAPFVPDGEVSRFLYIGEDVIFGGKKPKPRSGYASIGFQGYGFGDFIDQDLTLDENLDGIPDLAASTVEILADFTSALREGAFDGLNPSGDGTYGPAAFVTATGLSNQSAAIRGAMAFGETHGFAPFDAAMPMAVAFTLTQNPSGRTAWDIPGPVDFGTQKALFVNTESEVAVNGTFDIFGFIPGFSTIPLRSEADDMNRFVYELPGAAHLDPVNQQDVVNLGLVPPESFDDSSPLDWGPIRRAIYVQMRDWVMNGDNPEASRIIDDPIDPTAPDPAYPGHPSVEFARVKRDSNLNATGGIRHPNVELGVGTYLGVGPPITFSGDILVEFFQWLAGGFNDLSCSGEEAHDKYVDEFSELTNQLARDRFILQSDAQAMRAQARASTIGLCQ